MIRTSCFFLIVLSLTNWMGAEPRVLTLRDTNGASINAVIESVKGDKVLLRKDAGRLYRVPLNLFDFNSRVAILREEQRLRAERGKNLPPAPVPEPVAPTKPSPVAVPEVTFRDVNEALGASLLGDENLWDDTPEQIANRIGWPRESRTAQLVSHRAYPSPTYRFVGARPYSAAFYGEPQRVTHFSLVYANKGDCFASAGSGKEHFKEGAMTKDPRELEKWLQRDFENIRERLEGAFGQSRRQKFGQGSARRNVSRWDWNGHSFLLSIVEGEFVSLSIETVASADGRGKVRKMADPHARRIHRANVRRRPNGDVVIDNLPMVDQGPKGYCVPATFERCMRYMQVPADMYFLAMAGNTKLGGGTIVEELLKSIKREVWSAGRNFRTIDGHPSMKEVAKWIDEGVPIVWALYSTDQFNDIADQRTSARKEADPKEWAEAMKEVAKDASLLPKANDSAHVVIIHGYNSETGEIAFTDSWGEKFGERWITLAESSRFSQDCCWVIDY
ncbi:MAG: hypothetical protein VB980_07485 [Opitutales bacterium]